MIFEREKAPRVSQIFFIFFVNTKTTQICVTFFVRYFLFLKKYKKLREKRVIEFVRHFFDAQKLRTKHQYDNDHNLLLK